MTHRNEHITRELFDTLYSEYRPRLIRIAQSYVRIDMVAEDIVTDSFLYYWEHRKELNITTSVPAYILGAVKHGCLEWLRNEKNRLKIRQKIHTTTYYSIQARISALEACDPEQIFASEVASIVREEIDKMPEQMRRIFVASRFDGKTYREIADATGVSVRNVKAAIQKALGIMREALKDYLPTLITALALNALIF
ncbi:RNA polymerase sigma-70 factor [uncultured Alistipes sp.]|jgi:RNA polymerase sigma-70 factor|uniref:RNA polymerase sigma-70 factor n=1 Tax=uncultured Alistipes sp. TaxID=538949 RepID=UPI0025DB2BF6|nr:RNA polymerase sigma-70 factor [uncultured Alistipes sp.]